MRMATLVFWAAAATAPLPAVAQGRPPAYAASSVAQARPLPPLQRLERRFLQISAADLRFQAEGSRIAIARSKNPAVKDLANTVLARQQAVQLDLLRMLHARGMAMPIMTNEHARVLKQMGKLQGPKFDRLYVDEVVVRTYQADIANHERMAMEAADPVLKGWADRQLPTLRMHLEKAGRALPPAGLRSLSAPYSR
jgi:putative membrane protein